MRIPSIVSILTVVIFSLSEAGYCETRAPAPEALRISQRYAELPLSFEPNVGQSDKQVRFLAHGRGYDLFLLPTEAAIVSRRIPERPLKSQIQPERRLGNGVPKSAILRMQFVGANSRSSMTGLDIALGKSSYFIGNDPEKWRTDIPRYGKVRYSDLYSGIDVVFYGNQETLEFDFVLQPGADPTKIKLRFQGAPKVGLDDAGNVTVYTDDGITRLHKPTVYQDVHGVRKEISGQFTVSTKNEIGFRLGVYDPLSEVVIDPTLVFSSYLGGRSDDLGRSVFVDPPGNVYVSGDTGSSNFPLRNPLQGTLSGTSDLVVMKFNPAGSLVYSTFIGGSGNEIGHEIIVDAAGNAYVVGRTSSDNFPALGGFQLSRAGREDGCVLKLNPSGSSLVYASYLGGTGSDSVHAMALDSSGNLYITGRTSSDNFPTRSPFQAARGGGDDVFVAKVNNTGSALVYSTFLGGSRDEEPWGIGIDSLGNAYVGGWTASANFPLQNALQSAYAGNNDVFITKLNPSGSSLAYSTFVGGSESDRGFDLVVDSGGNAYVTGSTHSTNFPTRNALQPARGGDVDAFILKINNSGSALVYSTFLGSGGEDRGFAITIDSSGNAFVTGPVASPSFPGGGGLDVFVAKLNAAGTGLDYVTYLRDEQDDLPNAIAVDSSGNVYVTGETASLNFTIKNAFQSTFGGGTTDGFLAKISPGTSIHFAQFGDGLGFTSDLVFSNTSTTASASGKAEFFDDNGLPLVVGMEGLGPRSSVDISIPPRGTLTIRTDGRGQLAVGSAKVTTDNPIGGVIRFSIPGIGIAGVGKSEALTTFMAPVRRKAGGINTGIAIRNTESKVVSLTLTLVSKQGQQVVNGTSQIDNLPAEGHLAKFINELFLAAATDDFEGALVVQVSGGSVAATALELGTTPGQFTTLPVIPLN